MKLSFKSAARHDHADHQVSSGLRAGGGFEPGRRRQSSGNPRRFLPAFGPALAGSVRGFWAEVSSGLRAGGGLKLARAMRGCRMRDVSSGLRAGGGLKHVLNRLRRLADWRFLRPSGRRRIETSDGVGRLTLHRVYVSSGLRAGGGLKHVCRSFITPCLFVSSGLRAGGGLKHFFRHQAGDRSVLQFPSGLGCTGGGLKLVSADHGNSWARISSGRAARIVLKQGMSEGVSRRQSHFLRCHSRTAGFPPTDLP